MKKEKLNNEKVVVSVKLSKTNKFKEALKR